MRKLGVVDIVFWAWVVSLLLFASLEPRQPHFPAYEYGKPTSADYQAGGRGCEPSVLASIRDNGQAARERKRCAEAAEEHRLKREDLVQQTRAADAAQAQATLNFDLARMALWGTIGGFLTLIAAGVAAYFAREASRASWDMLRLEKARSTSDVRLQVYFETNDDNVIGPEHIKIVAKSHGGASATNVDVRDVSVSTSDGRFADLILPLVTSIGPKDLGNPGASRQFRFSAQEFQFGVPAMREGAYDDLTITVHATLEFMDWAGETQVSEQVWSGKVNAIKPDRGLGNPTYTTKLQCILERVK